MATELLQDFIRRIPGPALAVIRMVPYMAFRPRLTLDRNGRGDGYYTLRCRIPSRTDGGIRPCSFYVGALTEEEAGFIQTWITLYWMHPMTFNSHEDAERFVIRLRKERREALAAASRIAEAQGLYFAGYELRRRRRTPAAEGKQHPVCAGGAGESGGNEALRSAIGMVLMVNGPLISAITDALMDQLRRQAILLGCGAKRHVSTPVLRLISSLRRTYHISRKLIRADELLKTQAGAGEAA